MARAQVHDEVDGEVEVEGFGSREVVLLVAAVQAAASSYEARPLEPEAAAKEQQAGMLDLDALALRSLDKMSLRGALGL